MAAIAETFVFRAVDERGVRVSGSTSAPSLEAAAQQLEARGLVVLDVTATPADALATRHALRPGSRQDVLEATRALAALLGAGVPLVRALSLATSMVPPRIARVLDDVGARVAGGSAMSEALAAHPHEFSGVYRGVVRAGERSGNLAGSFGALARQLEAESHVRSRLVSATLYPLLLAISGTIVVAVLVLFVLPRFADLLDGTGSSLPRSTALLLGMSSWLREAWLPLLFVLGVVLAAGALFRRSLAGQRALARVVLLVPIVGSLRRHVLAARCARLLSVLLAGGAPLLVALDDALDSLTDPLARDELTRVRALVREGSSLNAALGQGVLFPPLFARLVAVGEESGRLRPFLESTAQLSEERVESGLHRLTTLIEPAMILAFGIVIAFVALALLQAIYGVNASTFG